MDIKVLENFSTFPLPFAMEPAVEHIAQQHSSANNASDPYPCDVAGLVLALDGELYTFPEFEEWYGEQHARRCWSEAVDRHQPLSPNVSHLAAPHSVSPPVAPPVAPQESALATSTQGWLSRLPAQVPWTPPSIAAQPDDSSGCDAPQYPQGTDLVQQVPDQSSMTTVLTVDGLERMPVQAGVGRKTACKWQRDLRTRCMNTGLYEIDITDSKEFNWRALLRAQPEGVRSRLVGEGVASFAFVLLRNALDHNYAKIDSGERHEFELTQVNGDRYHLHFHKNGRSDAPRFLPSRSAAQPSAIPTPPVASNQLIGRREAALAMDRLLGHTFGRPSKAASIDITDVVAFPWMRWLDNFMEKRAVLRGQVERVLIVRWRALDAYPNLVVCRCDNTFVVLHPHMGREVPLPAEECTNWRQISLLVDAVSVRTSWLRIDAAVASHG